MPVNYTVYYKYLEKKIEKPFYVFTLHHELIWEFFQNIGSVFLRLLKSILITSLIIDLYLGIRHIQYLIIHTVHACNFSSFHNPFTADKKTFEITFFDFLVHPCMVRPGIGQEL